METTNLINQGAKKKCDYYTQKIISKVEKFGYQTQFDAIKNEGFQDVKEILRALKKNKGDLPKSIEYIKNAPPKKERKQKFEKDEKTEKKPRKYHGKHSDQSSDDQDKNSQEKQQKKNERKQQRNAEKYKQWVEEIPQFDEFNDSMKLNGFEDSKKNFKALKKFSGDIQKATNHLNHKKILSTLELRKTFSKGEFSKIYLDCNNCFYLEQGLLKRSIKGEYKVVEEKLATLMKLFLTKYGSQIEIVLVFDNSILIQDQQTTSKFVDNTFKLITAKPKYQDADDALVNLASNESNDNQQKILYITSDRMLQARLVEQNAKHIIFSKVFFNIVKDEYVGINSYSNIIDA